MHPCAQRNHVVNRSHPRCCRWCCSRIVIVIADNFVFIDFSNVNIYRIIIIIIIDSPSSPLALIHTGCISLFAHTLFLSSLNQINKCFLWGFSVFVFLVTKEKHAFFCGLLCFFQHRLSLRKTSLLVSSYRKSVSIVFFGDLFKTWVNIVFKSQCKNILKLLDIESFIHSFNA